MPQAHVDAGAMEIGAAYAGVGSLDVDLGTREVRLGRSTLDDCVVGRATECIKGDCHLYEISARTVAPS